MSQLQQQIEQSLPAGMTLPEPLKLLFQRIDNNRQGWDGKEGRYCQLFTPDQLSDSWDEEKDEAGEGTDIAFMPEGNRYLDAWFGSDDAEIMQRLYVFAKTGAEGSSAAFWLDGNGDQKIVHMGSGSGSTMCCVLADNAVDFLRLLAIGYREICWDFELSEPVVSEGNFDRRANAAFQQWVMETFNTTIPATGTEIVKDPADMCDENPSDPFCRWVQTVNAYE